MAAFWGTSLGIWTTFLGLLSGPLFARSVDPVDLMSPSLNLDHGLHQDLALDSAQFWAGGSPQGSSGSLGFSSDELLSRSDSGGAVIRRKRNILFPNGVKLCTRETYEQVVHNHLQYFYLRVCQETVWEAFKVFWDRLPERDEYRSWVNLCLNQSLSIREIGLSFSRAEEHHRLILNRLGAEVNSSGPVVSKSEDWPTQALPVEEATLVQFGSSSITDSTKTNLDQDQKSPGRASPATSDLEIPTASSSITFTIQQEIQEFLQTTSKSTALSPLEGVKPEKDVLYFTLEPKTIPTQPAAVNISPSEVENKIDLEIIEATTQTKYYLKTTEKSTKEEEMTIEPIESKENGNARTETPILDSKMTEFPMEIAEDTSESQTSTPKIEVGGEMTAKPVKITEDFAHVSTAETNLELQSTLAEVKPTIFVEKDEDILFIEPTIKEELEVTTEFSVKETGKGMVTAKTEEDIRETFTTPSLEDKTVDKELPSQAEETEVSMDLVLEEKIVVVPTKEEEIMIESPSLEEEFKEDNIDKDDQMTIIATVKPSREKEVLVDNSEEEEQPLMPTQDEIVQENIDLTEDIFQPTLAESEATDIQKVTPDFEIVTKTPTRETAEEDGKLIELTTEMITKSTQLEAEDLEMFTPTVWVISEELPQETGEGMVETGTTKVEFTKVEPLEISPTEASTAQVSPTSAQSERPEQDGGAIEVLWTEEPSSTPEVQAYFETEEKVSDQEVDLTEEKVPDQEEDLTEKTEEKVPDQEEDLTEEKVPDQEEDLTEEKVPDQEEDLTEKTEEKVPDQEEDLTEKTEEKVPDQEEDLTEEKVPDQEVDLEIEESEEKVPDQDVDLKEMAEEKVPDQEVDLQTDEKVPDQEVDLKTEETERPGTEKPQRTTPYIVEYNNGNFADVTEPSLDLDLLRNNFGLEDEDTLGNEIGVSILRPLRPLKDQVLELSLRLREETYTDALRNPSSLQYQRLERVFTRKIVDAFERLPGFKNVQVVEFRPQKDLERGLVVSVHYAVTLEVDTGGVSNDTLDFITLQSNFVEKNYPRAEQPTVLYTITDFRNYITEALHIQINENVLPSAKPTTQPTDDFDNMDNILAAEKPPDAPTHESEPEVFLKKEDFLFDTFDFSKPKDEPRVSENDVIAIDEISTAAVDSITDATTTRPPAGRNNAEAVEEEDFLVSHWNQDSDQELGLRPGLSLDEGSGSGFSGDGPVLFSLDSDPGKVGLISPKVLPPPDLETSEDDLDEIPTSASTETAQITPKIQEFSTSIMGHNEEFEPTEAQISAKKDKDGVTVFEIDNSESESAVNETVVDQIEVSITEIFPKVEDFEATNADLVTKVEEIKTVTTTIKFVPETVESSENVKISESSLPQTTEPIHKITTEVPIFSTEGTITFELFGQSTESDNDFFFTKPVQPITELPRQEITHQKPNIKTEMEFGDIFELEKATEESTSVDSMNYNVDITVMPTQTSVVKGDDLGLALESLRNPPEIEEKKESMETPDFDNKENLEIVTIKPKDKFDAEILTTTVSPTKHDEVEELTSKSEKKQIDSTLPLEDEKPIEESPAEAEDTKEEDEIVKTLPSGKFEKSEIPELEISSHEDVEILEEQFLGVTETVITKTTISGLPSEDLSVDEVIAVTLPPKTSSSTTADTTTVSTSAVKITEKEFLDHEVKNQNKPDIDTTQIYPEISQKTTAPKIILESTPKMSEKEDLNVINPEIAAKPEVLTTEAGKVPLVDATQAPSVDILRTTMLLPQETTKMATKTSAYVISEPEKDSPFTRISDSVPEYEDETPVSTPTLTTEPLAVIKTSQDLNKFEIVSETTTISFGIFEDTDKKDGSLTSPKSSTTGPNVEKGLTLTPTVESIEVIPEIQTQISPITTSFEPILSKGTDQTDGESQIHQVEGITNLKPGVGEEESNIVPEDLEGSAFDSDTDVSSAVVIQMRPTLAPREKIQEEDLKIYTEISTVKTIFTVEKVEVEDAKLEIALASPRDGTEAPTLSENLENITEESNTAAEVNKIEIIPTVPRVLTSQTASSELSAPDVLSTTSSSFEMKTSSKTVETLPTTPPNVEIQISRSDSPIETLTEQISDSEIGNVLPLTPSNKIEKQTSSILEDSTLFLSELPAFYTTPTPILEILPTATAKDDSEMSVGQETNVILVENEEITTRMPSSDLETKADTMSKMIPDEDSRVVFTEDNLTKETVEISSKIPTVELETKMEESLTTVEPDSKDIVHLSAPTQSIKIKPDASNVEKVPTITRDDDITVTETDSSVVLTEDNLTKETVEIPSLIQSSADKQGDTNMHVISTALVENVETPSIIPISEYETKTEKSLPTVSPNDVEALSKIPASEPETKAEDSSDQDHNTVRLFSEGFSDSSSFDVSFDLVPFGSDGSGAVPGDGEVAGSIPGVSDSLQTQPERALTVFFSLRVTNMVFNQNLFNKSSDEYRRLEQRFVTLLVPFLESNLNNFQELQILNFQNGSVVVNSRLKFVTPVRRGLTTAVYLVLKDFAASAQKTMDLRIDKSSLDVESGERADACKFLGCNRFSRCRLNPVSLEPECVCLPGYLSVDGLPCLSVCQLEPDFCKNDGKCDVVPGKGAICRCRVGENWFFRGEHCEEFVSETLVVFGAVGSVLGFLFVTVVIVYFLSKFLQQQEPEDDNSTISGDGQKWDRSRYQIPVKSETPVMVQSYRRYDDHLLGPPSYPQAPPSMPTYSSGISRQEMEERLRILELCSRDQAFNEFMQTTLFLERRGSSST